MSDRKERLKEITDKLENGINDVFSSGKYEEYLQAMGKFHNYSLNNCILIAIQCPHASMVAGYKMWKDEFGRFVKKGEKAIRILAPMTRKKVVKTHDVYTGEEKEEETDIVTYRPVSVFDVSQTDGKEMPEIAKKLTGDKGGELVGKVVNASPVPVRFEPVEGDANGYYHLDGYIVVDSALSASQKLKTLVHEIAHATLHCKDGKEAGAKRNAKEVQAESVAYTVCNYFGIDTSDYSFGYIAGWSAGKELKELKESLEVIRNASAQIISGIEAAISG